MNSQKIIVGVTGGIAAYKAAEIVRGLQKRGFDVWVVMTASATKFITALTFESLTGHPVCLDLFDNEISPYAHITLAEDACAMVVAPCTANTLAKLACGMADNALCATALALEGKLIVAPAMNMHMYLNGATQENLATLRERGAFIIEPVSGHLACGDEGIGKLPEPDFLVEQICEALA